MLSSSLLASSPGARIAAASSSSSLNETRNAQEFGDKIREGVVSNTGSRGIPFVTTGSKSVGDVLNQCSTSPSGSLTMSSIGSISRGGTPISVAGSMHRPRSRSSIDKLDKANGTRLVSTTTPLTVQVGFDLNSNASKSKPPIGMLRHELAGEFGYDAFDSEAYRRAIASVPEIFAEPGVRQAFEFCAKSHAGPGLGPHFEQCVDVAISLAKLGMDHKTVTVGLLHDALDVTNTTVEDLNAVFSEEVVELVSGVARLARVSKLHRSSWRDLEHDERAQFRAMILAMTDARVVIVKLAARLIKMRNLHSLPPAQQKRYAEETLAIYAPLAARLGIFTIKNDLEDAAFRWVNPTVHAELSARLESRSQRDAIISALTTLDDALSSHRPRVEVIDMCGRQKSLYSVYKKMMEKGQALEDIMDVRAIRVIIADGEDEAANEAACRSVLEYVHQIWTPVEGRLKDYVTTPKSNGYKSIHTVVRDENDTTLEVQIRTASMHRTAEFGVAAHWRYKESEKSATSAKVSQQIQWARFMLTWQNELEDSQKIRPARMADLIDCGAALKPCLFPEHHASCAFHEDKASAFCQSCDVVGSGISNQDEPVYVITVVDGSVSVHALAQNASLDDLRLEDSRVPGAARSSEFYRVLSVKVNKKSIPRSEFSTLKLSMGDVVEINRTQIMSPNKSWDENDDVSVFEDLNLEIHTLGSKAVGNAVRLM